MGSQQDGDKCHCMVSATLCCYSAIDCGHPVWIYKSAEDCLCIRHSCCLAVNAPTKGCGCTTEQQRGEICKIGLFCCDLGLIVPVKLCGCASQCLCCYEVVGFPCESEFIPEVVCTICCPCLQIAPKVGCCIPPPPCPALDKVRQEDDDPPEPQTMERDAPVPAKSVTKEVLPDGSTVIKEMVPNPDGSMSVTETRVPPQAIDRRAPAPAKNVTREVLPDGTTVIKEMVPNPDGSTSVTETHIPPNMSSSQTSSSKHATPHQSAKQAPVAPPPPTAPAWASASVAPPPPTSPAWENSSAKQPQQSVQQFPVPQPPVSSPSVPPQNITKETLPDGTTVIRERISRSDGSIAVSETMIPPTQSSSQKSTSSTTKMQPSHVIKSATPVTTTHSTVARKSITKEVLPDGTTVIKELTPRLDGSVSVTETRVPPPPPPSKSKSKKKKK